MARFRIQAFVALARQYADVFSTAWAERAPRPKSPSLPHEVAFLPGHLELLETPAHPAAHWLIRMIGALAVLVFAVIVFGRLAGC